VEYTPDSAAGRCLFSRLASGINEGEDFAAGDSVFDRLFELLKHAANKIAKNEDLRSDALSLVGRALFFRFLRDRGVLDNYPVLHIAPKAFDWSDCFADARNASATCTWLDRTFNGDFLPLTDNGSESFFSRIGKLTEGEIFRHLSAVVRGHRPLGNDYQPLLRWDWESFDFAHIPVGLLSQVYEAFSWEWTPKEAKKTSQRYTPRNIAVTLLDEVFDTIPDIASCRVLDPACGAGVFLVLAFRRLYLEHWKRAKQRKRPGTEEIRRILENQLVGLDISESALKLASLSLYLTAIELDPSPSPPDKLKFKNLRSRVLHNVREPGAKDGAALGSLGSHVGRKFDGKFDVVVSNPPWTSVHKELGENMAGVCREVIERIDGEKGKEYLLPDNNPDLPFLWKATEWCKPGGRIAMALPARILLKTEPTPSAARVTLFSLLQIDGIINGTNLADTPVWPEMSQPWMLLFATNKRPGPNHSVYFVTLPLELSLNKTGEFRIDSKSARPVDIALTIKKPWIWKALSVGTILDVEAIEKMRAAGGEPLEDYWKRAVGRYRHGKGYIRGKPEQRTRDAQHLKGLPNLDSTDTFTFAVDPSVLQPFGHDRVQWPRRESIYEPPLVLVKESPGENRRAGRGLLCMDKIAYNESFSGYSAAGHSQGELLVRYLHLFVHSDIWLYYLLVTSPQFGAERRRFHKDDLEKCPIPPFEKLSDDEIIELKRLSKSLEGGGAVPWSNIDAFFARLYGLDEGELQVIRDTLSVALPYEASRRRACRPPSETEKKTYMSALGQWLSPFVRAGGASDLSIVRSSFPVSMDRVTSPYEVLVLTSDRKADDEAKAIADGSLGEILSLADETGATQLLISDPPHLVVGIYNQYRYWTLSRARLLSGEIIRYHLDSITG
jgi:hypothetical protein